MKTVLYEKVISFYHFVINSKPTRGVQKNRKTFPVKVLKTDLGFLDIAESNLTWGI